MAILNHRHLATVEVASESIAITGRTCDSYGDLRVLNQNDYDA